VQNLYLAFGLVVTTNETLYLHVKFCMEIDYEHAINSIRNTVCVSTITNIVAV